jgi:hypothetical protein
VPDNATVHDKPFPWVDALPGILPFALAGLMAALASSHNALLVGLSLSGGYLLLVGLIGLTIARGFSAYVYPALGLAVGLIIFIASGAITQSYISGKGWAWIAGLLLVGAVLAGWLASLSLDPRYRTPKAVWEDWTRLSFCGFGALAALMVWWGFQSTQQIIIINLVESTAVLCLAALFFLRSPDHWQRGLCLQLGMILAPFTGEMVSALFWSLAFRGILTGTKLNSTGIFMYAILVFAWLFLMFVPAIPGLLSRRRV